MESTLFKKDVPAMKKSYQLNAASRMFEQVARQIGQYIETEKLEPGAKLPTERELSQVLEVSRSSVREGIRVLEILGFLESRHGEGTFVSNPPLFLMPHRVIGVQLKQSDLQHYYHLSLMLARQIMDLSIQQNIPNPNIAKEQTFWENLLLFIGELGERLDNPLYAALWLDTLEPLIQSGALLKEQAPFDLQEMIQAYKRSDKNKIYELLNKLAEVL
jgi:GntR family transcriptional repressor for pyruvate dehydrogenase complex